MLILKKFLRDVPAVLGFVIIVAVILVALVAPPLASVESVYDGNLMERLKPPSAEHWFGTDNLGRDIFARVMVGSQGALAVALSVVVIAIAIGVPAGLYAGYTSGWGSELVMRVTDVFLSVPQLILALAVAQLIGKGLESADAGAGADLLAVLLPHVFAETRRVRNTLFVDALEGIGASRWRILLVHVLPNVALAGDRARHHRHGLHHPDHGRARLPRHRRDAALARLGPRHLREPRVPARTPGGP